MPPVRMFNRYWRISSDDFVCPAATELLVRLSWIVILTFVLIFHVLEVENLECLGAEYQLTTYYLGITLALLTVTCITNLLLLLHSSRGRIVEPPSDQAHPRAWVEPLLYINIGLTVLEFFWTVLGAYFAIKDFIRCRDQEHERTVILAVLVIIVLFYILLLVKLLLVLCSFRPYAKVRTEEERRLLGSEEREQRQSELNYLGLRCIAPCTNDEEAIKAFKDIADILSKVFRDKDLVPSDVLSGLILLSHKTRREKDEGRDSLGVVGRTVFDNMGVSLLRVDVENDEGGSCLELVSESERIRLDWAETKHFYKYAAAAYGYMWWMMQSPLTHCCKLSYYIHCCGCRQSHDFFVEGDGVFKPNLAAIKAMLKVSEEDIIMFDNRNMIEEVPFLLVADRTTKSLVISIRGTLSLHDMLTDLRGDPGQIGDLNPEWTAHLGMVNCAMYVLSRLHGEAPVRERSLRSGGGLEQVSQTSLVSQKSHLASCLESQEYKDYQLVVTGHSLGAGTAAILAFLLREKYPDRKVRCYAYSPPGGLLSLAAAKESEKFTLSVLVGDDVIPRLSLRNIGTLSSDIKHSITSCSLPKYQIFGYGCLACLCKTPRSPLSAELDRLYPPGTVRSEEVSLPQQSTSSHPATQLMSSPPMFLPGRVLHIQSSGRQGEAGEDLYRLVERRKEDFDQILVSPRMLSDHLPNHLHKVFKSCPDNLNILPVLI